MAAVEERDVSGDWLARYAQALGVEPLGEAEAQALLDLARDVAHGSERKHAPLSTFLAGVLAGRGGDRAAALRAATEAAEGLTGDE